VGKLREFRDAGKLNYRVEEVDALVAEKAGGLSGSSGELVLEPADDSGTKTPAASGSVPGLTGSVPGLSGSFSGSSILSLADTDIPEKPPAKSGTGPAAKSGTGPSAKSGSGPSAKSGSGPSAKSGSGSTAVKLEDSDIALSGSDVLSLEEAEKDVGTGMRKDDTVITNVGISVFDDDDLEIAADPMAKTIATGATEHLGLEGSGVGSGLLDLTRESDDTSLGADVLGDIELTEEDVTQTATATATTGMEEPAHEEAAAEPVPVAPRYVVVAGALPADPNAPVFAGLLVAGMIVLAILGSATAAMTLDVWPGYLDAIYIKLPIFFGGTVVAGGLFALIGWLVGRKPAPRREPAKRGAV
jgi:hypothetical protein